MFDVTAPAVAFPTPLQNYPPPADGGLLATLGERITVEPFNAIATAIFLIAIVHTFVAPRFATLAHTLQHLHDEEARVAGRAPRPSVSAEMLHFFGEIEVVFGLWAVALLAAVTVFKGWEPAKHYFSEGVNYTEPLFVVVIMALAATRPIIAFAEAALRRVASLGGATPAAWWVSILTIGPLLGSFITEPAAMTICALLLARQFYDLEPSTRLKYATLGLLFVNVSIGGTLTHFAAPPVLMVARPWGWDLGFMLTHFGWRATLALCVSTLVYFVFFRRELRDLALRARGAGCRISPRRTSASRASKASRSADGAGQPLTLLPVPVWLTIAHGLFMAWTVFNAHYPALLRRRLPVLPRVREGDGGVSEPD